MYPPNFLLIPNSPVIHSEFKFVTQKSQIKLSTVGGF